MIMADFFQQAVFLLRDWSKRDPDLRAHVPGGGTGVSIIEGDIPSNQDQG